MGGGLNHDEDPIVGLKREIFEETGLTVMYVSPSPNYIISCPRLGGGVIQTYIANVRYEIRLESMNFAPSVESQELRFFSKEEMDQIEPFPNVEKLCEILWLELVLFTKVY